MHWHMTFALFLLPVQGLTVEEVCKQLRHLYIVKNFSLEHSVSITCDPSFSASNEIHVCIVSTSSYSQSAICFSASINAYPKIKPLLSYYIQTNACSNGICCRFIDLNWLFCVSSWQQLKMVNRIDHCQTRAHLKPHFLLGTSSLPRTIAWTGAPLKRSQTG